MCDRWWSWLCEKHSPHPPRVLYFCVWNLIPSQLFSKTPARIWVSLARAHCSKLRARKNPCIKKINHQEKRWNRDKPPVCVVVPELRTAEDKGASLMALWVALEAREMYVCWYNYGGHPAVALPQATISSPTPISTGPTPLHHQTIASLHAPEYLIPVSPQSSVLTPLGIPRKVMLAREWVPVCQQDY